VHIVRALVAPRLHGARPVDCAGSRGSHTKPVLTIRWRGELAPPLRIAPGGFAQPSDAGAAILAKRVALLAESALVPARPRHMLELFAGSGTLSILLAPLAASFLAIEADPDTKSVIYVACDPATLARDLGVLLGACFLPVDIETFELFPQTSHVETVVRLVRARPTHATR
jgi:23S rRNA (uracil1939-C5)-methyltransferase